MTPNLLLGELAVRYRWLRWIVLALGIALALGGAYSFKYETDLEAHAQFTALAGDGSQLHRTDGFEYTRVGARPDVRSAAALNRAKNSGRNCAVMADAGTH